MPTIGRHVSKLSGYAPALPTPFGDDGKVDGAAFERFCDRQIRAGATALVVCGTTGEAPTLRPAEHHVLVRIAVDAARGRIPVIAGAGSNSTAHAIELTRDAEAGGADAILSVVPYYNKPTQAGMHAHFHAIAQSTGLPIILYDVPSRTVCGLADETIARLAEMPEYHRAQGRHRRCQPAGAAAPARRSGFQAPDRRRRDRFGFLCARRQRLHFGYVERCARSVPEHVSGTPAGADRQSAAIGSPGCAIDCCAVPGNEPGSAQIRAEPAWPDVAQSPLAAGRIDRPEQGRRRRRHGATVRSPCRRYDRHDGWSPA